MPTYEEKYEQMILQNRQIILPLDENGITKEYAIWQVSEENEELEIWMYPLDVQIYGDFETELIIGDYDMTSTLDFDEDCTPLVLQHLDNPSSWDDVKYAEIKEGDEEDGEEMVYEDRMVMIREGADLPEGATGKFLVPFLTDSGIGFKYEEEAEKK